MCVIERKTYYQAGGIPKSFERIRRCENAIGAGTCSNTTRVFDEATLVETRPEPSSSPADVVVTESGGRTRVYRDLHRRSSHKKPKNTSSRKEDRNPLNDHRKSPSPAFGTRRHSPVRRPPSPSSAPPRMSSFPTTLPPDPMVDFTAGGTAVYDHPPSLSMPRADLNERWPVTPTERKVSFTASTAGDGEINPSRYRRRPSLSITTEPHRPTNSSPIRASPGLSRLSSIRHTRKDSGHDLPPRETLRPSHRNDDSDTRKPDKNSSGKKRVEDTEVEVAAAAARRRQKALEDAENANLDLEGQNAQIRRVRLPSQRSSLDSERSSWSRHTSPPRVPRPAYSPPRYLSSSPMPSTKSHRRPTYERPALHHYADSPVLPSQRPNASIWKRGREVLEGGSARAAVDEDSRETSQRWQPVFDEVEERVSGREYHYVSEGRARQRVRQKRDRDEPRWEDNRRFWP